MAKQAFKVHFYGIRERRHGLLTTTLCGRMSGKGADGINSTNDRAQVTCKFCLRLLAEVQA